MPSRTPPAALQEAKNKQALTCSQLFGSFELHLRVDDSSAGVLPGERLSAIGLAQFAVAKSLGLSARPLTMAQRRATWECEML